MLTCLDQLVILPLGSIYQMQVQDILFFYHVMKMDKVLMSCSVLATFQTPLATFFLKKRLATNLATFGKTLATFQMSPVLSCEREILSYSPCVCSDQ